MAATWQREKKSKRNIIVQTCAEYNENTEEMKRHLAVLLGGVLKTIQHLVDF